MERELKFLGEELENPARPFVVILGGAKVSDKIQVIDRLLERANTILIGGAMAYTFRLAQGFKTGKSLVETDKADVAKAALTKAKEREVRFLLPTDDVVAVPVKTDKLDKKGKPVIDYQNVRVNRSCDDKGLFQQGRRRKDDFVEWSDGLVRGQALRRRHVRSGPRSGGGDTEKWGEERHRRR